MQSKFGKSTIVVAIVSLFVSSVVFAQQAQQPQAPPKPTHNTLAQERNLHSACVLTDKALVKAGTVVADKLVVTGKAYLMGQQVTIGFTIPAGAVVAYDIILEAGNTLPPGRYAKDSVLPVDVPLQPIRVQFGATELDPGATASPAALTMQALLLQQQVQQQVGGQDAVLKKLDEIGTSVNGLRTDVQKLDKRVGGLETRVEALETKPAPKPAPAPATKTSAAVIEPRHQVVAAGAVQKTCTPVYSGGRTYYRCGNSY
jgi:hypothetical protein